MGIFLAMVFLSQNAFAQSSLFSIPTADVIPTGKTYLEADYDVHFGRHENGGFQSFGTLAVHGVSRRVEVGMNVYFTRFGAAEHSLELQPNSKFQVYRNEKSGIAVATGVILYIPIKNRSTADTFGSVYTTVSKQISGKYGPRFTTGVYALIARDRGRGNTKGAMFGYEQPLHKKLSFIADWNTGMNRFGYAAAGLGLTVSKRSGVYAAYYFGNKGRGNNSLGVYYSVTF